MAESSSRELHFLDDVSIGYWLPDLVRSYPTGRVDTVVPRTYASYVRVLHPAFDRSGHRVRWADICSATGQEPSAVMQWQHISNRENWRSVSATRDVEHLLNEAPEVGTLDSDDLRALLAVLSARSHDDTPCVLGVWDGWAWVSEPFLTQGGSGSDTPCVFSSDTASTPRLRLHQRDYLLLSGALKAVPLLGSGMIQSPSPNLLWPVDRSWFVATEIDFDSTIVAGNEDLCSALLRTEGLEAWPLLPDDSLSLG